MNRLVAGLNQAILESLPKMDEPKNLKIPRRRFGEIQRAFVSKFGDHRRQHRRRAHSAIVISQFDLRRCRRRREYIVSQQPAENNSALAHAMEFAQRCSDDLRVRYFDINMPDRRAAGGFELG